MKAQFGNQALISIMHFIKKHMMFTFTGRTPVISIAG